MDIGLNKFTVNIMDIDREHLQVTMDIDRKHLQVLWTLIGSIYC